MANLGTLPTIFATSRRIVDGHFCLDRKFVEHPTKTQLDHKVLIGLFPADRDARWAMSVTDFELLQP